MKLSKKEIGEELEEQLNKGYSIERISNWAHYLFINLREEPSLEIDDILRSIFIMDAGPEFEYTEKELRILAKLLIDESEEPIRQLDSLRKPG